MSDLEAAVAQAAAVFETLGIPYMLIGGLAVSVWGEPRATIDADFTVWTEPDDFEQTVLRLCESFQCLTRNPVEFARRARILPIRTAQGIRMDIISADSRGRKRRLAALSKRSCREGASPSRLLKILS